MLPLARPVPPLPGDGSPTGGAPRQLAWALTIHGGLYPAIRRFALARANHPALPAADQDRYRDALRCIGLQADATYWIDVRHRPVARIVADAIARGATDPSR